MEWNGVEWILVEYDYFKTCWPARPASRRFFFNKMDFTRAQLGQTNSNAKDNDQQDISHLAFFPNSPRLTRLFLNLHVWKHSFLHEENRFGKRVRLAQSETASNRGGIEMFG